MKRFLFLTLTLLLMAGTAAFAQDKKQKKQADIQVVTFVTTIDSKNCVKKAEAVSRKLLFSPVSWPQNATPPR